MLVVVDEGDFKPLLQPARRASAALFAADLFASRRKPLAHTVTRGHLAEVGGPLGL
jgi:hypothetical protein